MPAPPENTWFKQTAADLISEARAEENPQQSAVLREYASTMALLAVAEGLSGIREQLVEVTDALEDQNGFGAGGHLRNISDWLEQIAKRSP
jgi:hypothetical protein